MFGAVGLVDDVGDMTAFIDNESDAIGNSEQVHCGPHQSTAAYGSVGAADGTVSIGDQGETKIVFFRETLVGGGILRGNAENGCILGLNFLIMIAK